MSRIALITGATGQDGAGFASHLTRAPQGPLRVVVFGPARASARATARPMTPAPTTRHSTDSIFSTRLGLYRKRLHDRIGAKVVSHGRSVASQMAKIAVPHLAGTAAPERSTFADANRGRDARMFSNLFETMFGQRERGFRRKMADDCVGTSGSC
jgi:hypothetical protein